MATKQDEETTTHVTRELSWCPQDVCEHREPASPASQDLLHGLISSSAQTQANQSVRWSITRKVVILAEGMTGRGLWEFLETR